MKEGTVIWRQPQASPGSDSFYRYLRSNLRNITTSLKLPLSYKFTSYLIDCWKLWIRVQELPTRLLNTSCKVQDTSSGNLARDVQKRGREGEKGGGEREREPLFRKFTTIHFWPSTVSPGWRISSYNIHPGSRLCTHPFAFPKVADFSQQYVVWNASSFICLNFIYIFTHPANTDQWSSCFVVQSFQNLFGHAIQLLGLTSRGVCYVRLRCATTNSGLLCSVLQARDSGAWSFGRSLFLSLYHRRRHYAEALYLWNRVVLSSEVVQPHCMIYCKFHSNSMRL